MQIKQHPKRQLKKVWIDCIRSEAPLAEKAGRLTKKQLALFYEQGWFKALAPKKYGGLQWTLSKVVRFEEAIGWADGSAGWTFTLCSGAGWFGGFMEAGFAKKIFRPKKACVAGSGAPGGLATMDGKGRLMIDGYWQYATGAPHATLFTANYLLEDESTVKTCGFFPAEVVTSDNWMTIGLKASASWAFSVHKKKLKPGQGFSIDPTNPLVDAVLYRFPFLALAEATIAANLSGMALHFLEETKLLWETQGKIPRSTGGETRGKSAQKSTRLTYLNRQMENWQKASQALHQAVSLLEMLLVNAYQQQSQSNITQTKGYLQRSDRVSETAQALARVCRMIVFEVYGHTGLTGANPQSPLNKVWRDFQTGSQHALFEAPFG